MDGNPLGLAGPCIKECIEFAIPPDKPVSAEGELALFAQVLLGGVGLERRHLDDRVKAADLEPVVDVGHQYGAIGLEEGLQTLLACRVGALHVVDGVAAAPVALGGVDLQGSLQGELGGGYKGPVVARRTLGQRRQGNLDGLHAVALLKQLGRLHGKRLRLPDLRLTVVLLDLVLLPQRERPEGRGEHGYGRGCSRNHAHPACVLALAQLVEAAADDARRHAQALEVELLARSVSKVCGDGLLLHADDRAVLCLHETAAHERGK